MSAKNYIRDGAVAQFQIDSPNSFSGENILRITTLNGNLRLEYVTRAQIISSAVLSVEDIFYYLPRVLERLNNLHNMLLVKKEG